LKKYFNILASFIIAAVCLIIYSNTFGSGFYFDDGYNFTENFLVKNIFRPGLIWNYNPTRFITLFTLSFNYQIGGLNPAGYHIFNILVHIAASILVFRLAKLTLGLPGIKEKTENVNADYAALFIALIFAAHPLQTQAVTYIIQRAASMASMFYIASVLFYAEYRLKKGGKGGAEFYILSLISCLLGMFTKEIVFTLPLMIVVYELLFFYDGSRKAKVGLIPYLLTLPVIPLTIKFMSPGAAKEMAQASNQISAYSYFITQFKVILTYIRLVFLPVGQNLDYDYPLSTGFFEPATLISFLALAGLFILGLYFIRRNRLVSFGIFWFFLTLAVESSIMPIRDVIFEHRMYLPMAGAAFLIVYLLSEYIPLKFSRILFYAGAIVIVALAGAAFARNKVWANEYTLWNDAVQKSPRKARCYSNRGVALLNMKKYDDAISDFNKALSINKNFKNAYFNRGSAFYYKKEYDKAAADFTKTIALDSAYAFAYNNLGAILLERRQIGKALSCFKKALKNDTNYAAAYNNRGVLAKAVGDYETAAQYYKKAIQKNSSYAEAYFNLGEINMFLGDNELAAGYFSRAISYNNKYVEAYYNRANVSFILGRLTDALNDYNFVIENNPQKYGAYNNRGSVYFMLGRYIEALADYDKALSLNPAIFDALKNRGITYMILNKPEKALDDFAKALEIRTGDPEVCFYRGKTLIKTGQKRKAAADIRVLRESGYRADENRLAKTESFNMLPR
jgi:tetratricopeptide (TPR) repeat protein